MVLVLGNSFCLVEPKDRRKCLEELVSILWSKTGTLIIDERNFADLIDKEVEYTSNPLTFPSARRPDPVYRGKSVRGCPEEINPEKIRWRIFAAEPPIRSPEELKSRWIGKKAFELYPFKKGELYEELGRHFYSIQVFADFEPLPEGSFSAEQSMKPQPLFYTYVASCPRDIL